MSDTGKMSKLKIGVIIDSLHESYQSAIWEGISVAASIQEVDLVSFISTSQDRIDSFDVHYNVIQDFVLNANIDGVIIFAGSISEHQGAAFSEGFCQRFKQLPVVCISADIPGLPSILVENSAGIIELLEHFVTVHNLQSIAFIKGPDGHGEAEERFAAYKEGLAQNNIPYREELVYPGQFSEDSGKNAVAALFDNNIDFDSILAVDDETAFGAISEIKRRREHVPTRVAIGGFDDVPQSALTLPSLTTIKQPLFNLGETAVTNVVAQAKGEMVERLTVLPTQPVYRRSCGCFSDVVRNAKSFQKISSNLGKERIITSIFTSIEFMLKKDSSSYVGDRAVQEYLSDLVESLVWDVEKTAIREIFLNEVDLLLFKFEELGDNIAIMQQVLSELMVHVASLFLTSKDLSDANNILQQAQTLVREHKLRLAQTKYLLDTLFQLKIRETSQTIITTFEQRKLLNAIASGFPGLNIDSFILALYVKSKNRKSITTDNWEFPSECQLWLGYNLKKGMVTYNRGQKAFPSAQLVPEELVDLKMATNHIFMPLFFEDEHFGFALFEYTFGLPLFMYEELRLHISSALKSSFLMKELKIQSMLDELTGLHNRRGFMSVGKKMLNSAKQTKSRLMLFYGDLDGLKGINDTYGHEEGDVAICGAASVLRTTFREQDLLARIGGDEYTAILIVEDDEGLEEKILQRLKISLDTYNEIVEKPYKLSLSIGAATIEHSDEKSLDEIMKVADDRLMEKKRARKAAQQKTTSKIET